ncbi:MAG: hypothetical protein M3537_06435 [Chloroflexota bacterium]|nr:hypothetical protein [Chloroflexota bacterium]
MSIGEDRIEPGDMPKPKVVKATARITPKKSPPAKEPRRGWTVLTTLDRLMTILEEEQPTDAGMATVTKADLLRDPEGTYLGGLTAPQLIVLLRQAALEEALDQR